MRTESNAEQHNSPDLRADLEPPIISGIPWWITHVEVLENHRLRVTFRDGLSGIVDLSRRIHAPDAGVFAALADPGRFAQATIVDGAVTWPGEIDLAPDAMHHALQQSPIWTL